MPGQLADHQNHCDGQLIHEFWQADHYGGNTEGVPVFPTREEPLPERQPDTQSQTIMRDMKVSNSYPRADQEGKLKYLTLPILGPPTSTEISMLSWTQGMYDFVIRQLPSHEALDMNDYFHML